MVKTTVLLLIVSGVNLRVGEGCNPNCRAKRDILRIASIPRPDGATSSGWSCNRSSIFNICQIYAIECRYATANSVSEQYEFSDLELSMPSYGDERRPKEHHDVSFRFTIVHILLRV